jgi:Flp pilus assembly protein TadB
MNVKEGYRRLDARSRQHSLRWPYEAATFAVWFAALLVCLPFVDLSKLGTSPVLVAVLIGFLVVRHRFWRLQQRADISATAKQSHS